jgi:hypothetical protein
VHTDLSKICFLINEEIFFSGGLLMKWLWIMIELEVDRKASCLYVFSLATLRQKK